MATELTPKCTPMPISIIACMAENGAIGADNDLLYSLKEDMQRFKLLTTGHTVIMGKNTYLSLPHGALPHRRNVVLSTCLASLPDCEVYPNIEKALAQQEPESELFVIGGEEVYRTLLPLASRIYLTVVHDTPSHADTFFPATIRQLLSQGWSILQEKEMHEGTLSYTFIDLYKP